jgi:hypothetical protein
MLTIIKWIFVVWVFVWAWHAHPGTCVLWAIGAYFIGWVVEGIVILIALLIDRLK